LLSLLSNAKNLYSDNLDQLNNELTNIKLILASTLSTITSTNTDVISKISHDNNIINHSEHDTVTTTDHNADTATTFDSSLLSSLSSSSSPHHIIQSSNISNNVIMMTHPVRNNVNNYDNKNINNHYNSIDQSIIINNSNINTAIRTSTTSTTTISGDTTTISGDTTTISGDTTPKVVVLATTPIKTVTINTTTATTTTTTSSSSSSSTFDDTTTSTPAPAISFSTMGLSSLGLSPPLPPPQLLSLSTQRLSREYGPVVTSPVSTSSTATTTAMKKNRRNSSIFIRLPGKYILFYLMIMLFMI